MRDLVVKEKNLKFHVQRHSESFIQSICCVTRGEIPLPTMSQESCERNPSHSQCGQGWRCKQDSEIGFVRKVDSGQSELGFCQPSLPRMGPQTALLHEEFKGCEELCLSAFVPHHTQLCRFLHPNRGIKMQLDIGCCVQSQQDHSDLHTPKGHRNQHPQSSPLFNQCAA